MKTPISKRDLSGLRFGRLIANTRDEAVPYHWYCQCDCGNVLSTRAHDLVGGRATSCGCARRETLGKNRRTHGRTGTAEYRAWRHIKQRCYDLNGRRYADYGGRGIAMCERWRNSFDNFYADMGPRPSLKHSIDRIDNDGNYEPGNCRWATRSEQNSNTRRNRHVAALGETKTLAEWARASGLNHKTIADRLDRGWSPDRAVGCESEAAA